MLLSCSVPAQKYFRFVNSSGSEIFRTSSTKFEGILSVDNAAGFATVAETSSSSATLAYIYEVYIEY